MTGGLFSNENGNACPWLSLGYAPPTPANQAVSAELTPTQMWDQVLDGKKLRGPV